MKKEDLIFTGSIILFLLPFFVFKPVYDFYNLVNQEHPFVMSFVKFAILSTTGEVIGLRIRTGKYTQHGFGILPRMLVWGKLGIGIKMAFIIFGEGAPRMLAAMGVTFPDGNPTKILDQNFFSTFSGLQLLTAFTISLTMNTFFAPVFMTIHKITDTHILRTGGTLGGFFSPMSFGKILTRINWNVQWGFVFKKTIPLFWFPAHTITFLLPAEFRILFAAILGVVLGVLLSVASLKGR